ncbi:MAG: hypothetical protein RL078_88 [Bacteroidota bacterium]
MRVAFLTLVIFSFISICGFSQEKIQWTFSLNDSRCIEAKAQIETGWHLYSMHINPDAGPVPTQISLEKNKAFQLTEAWMEKGELIEKFEPNFGATVKYFENQYSLFAPVHIKKASVIKGELTYMLCDDKRCLPPKTIPFEIAVTPFKPEKSN